MSSEARKCSLYIERLPIKDVASVRRLLTEQQGEGWVCLTHRVIESFNGSNLEAGIPLSAEVIRSDGSSFQLRQQGEGWMAWVIKEVPGEELLTYEQKAFSTEKNKTWNYRIYWRQESVGVPSVLVWTPFLSRLIGRK
jgi:hypothetical protein